mgnify:CR=1 FL=1
MKLGKTARIILIVGAFGFAFYFMFQMKADAESARKNQEIQLNATEQVLPNLASQKEDLQEELAILEADLAEAESSLEETMGTFPEDIQSIEYDEILFAIADQWDLNVVSLTASEPSYQTVDISVQPPSAEENEEESEPESYSIEYTTTSFNITVEGKPIKPAPEEVEEFRLYIHQTVDDILGYFNTMATGDDFITARINTVNISIPEPYTELEVLDIEAGEEEEEATDTEDDDETEEEELLEAKPASASISLTIYSYEVND